MNSNRDSFRLPLRRIAPLFLFFYTISLTIFVHASDNTLLGLPAKEDEIFQVVDRNSFCLGYCEKHEQSAWVCYKLTKDEVLNTVVKRTNNFRPDPEIKTGSAQLVDYKGSGYDRGHLAPAGDMAWSLESMSDSFYLSNISPQQPGFNRGVWKNLEEMVRSWAIGNEEVFVVTGPLLTDGLITIGPNRVSVPDFYYKVILDLYGTEKKGIAFLLPNKPLDGPLSKYVKTIDDIELITGLDFFCKIPDSEEEKLESLVDYGAWETFSPLGNICYNDCIWRPGKKTQYKIRDISEVEPYYMEDMAICGESPQKYRLSATAKESEQKQELNKEHKFRRMEQDKWAWLYPKKKDLVILAELFGCLDENDVHQVLVESGYGEVQEQNLISMKRELCIRGEFALALESGIKYTTILLHPVDKQWIEKNGSELRCPENIIWITTYFVFLESSQQKHKWGSREYWIDCNNMEYQYLSDMWDENGTGWTTPDFQVWKKIRPDKDDFTETVARLQSMLLGR